jgi:hypothetical protein
VTVCHETIKGDEACCGKPATCETKFGKPLCDEHAATLNSRPDQKRFGDLATRPLGSGWDSLYKPNR